MRETALNWTTRKFKGPWKNYGTKGSPSIHQKFQRPRHLSLSFIFFFFFCFLFLSFTLTKSMLVPHPPPCWLRPIKKPSHLKKFQPVINRLLWKREFYIANSNFHLMTSAYRSQIFGAFFFSFPLIASSPSDRKPIGNNNNQSRHMLSVCTVCVCV